MDFRSESRVALAPDPRDPAYPPVQAAPYHPGADYPEAPFPDRATQPNGVYDRVRRALAGLGLDADRFGSAAWNPLGALVAPGSKIVVKPNWVLDHNEGNGGLDCLITHASVLRAALDYVLRTKPREVIVGDAPIQGCDFEALVARGSRPVVEYLAARGAPVRLVDFRRTHLRQREGRVEIQRDARPLEQYVLVDLGARSLLEPISGAAHRFRVTMYDPRRMREQHRPGVHRYLVARDVLEADLVVNLPKLKTHRKAGLTAALKNLVGINGDKDYLPHYRKGARTRGGDNYERFSPWKALAEAVLDLANRHLDRPWFYRQCGRLVHRLLQADVRRGGTGDVEGGWYGNDTVWRMCLDLNAILLYADAGGRLCDTPQRQVVSIADGIIAGQGEGPLRSDPLPLGIILAALNPAAADWVAAQVMGLDPARIPVIARSFQLEERPFACFGPPAISCVADGERVDPEEGAKRWGQAARPPAGWRGHCERMPEKTASGGG